MFNSITFEGEAMRKVLTKLDKEVCMYVMYETLLCFAPLLYVKKRDKTQWHMVLIVV